MAAMISRIEGELVGVGEGRAELRCGHLTYMLLVPAADQEGPIAGVVGLRKSNADRRPPRGNERPNLA